MLFLMTEVTLGSPLGPVHSHIPKQARQHSKLTRSGAHFLHVCPGCFAGARGPGHVSVGLFPGLRQKGNRRLAQAPYSAGAEVRKLGGKASSHVLRQDRQQQGHGLAHQMP